MCSVWEESVARQIAGKITKLMNVSYIAENEAHAYLFCMLTRVTAAELNDTISDIDASKIADGVLDLSILLPVEFTPEKYHTEK
jgi:hypothetical protein